MTHWPAAFLASLIASSTLAASLHFTEIAPHQVEALAQSLSADRAELIEGLNTRVDRLNAVTLPSDSDRRLAQQTLDLAVPLADQLGLSERSALEDAAFQVLHPHQHAQLISTLSPSLSEARRELNTLITHTEELLAQQQIDGLVTGRNKSLWGLFQKSARKDLAYNAIDDRTALRVRVNTVAECYEVVQSLHAAHHALLNRFDDYIQQPKESGYRSLHTSVIAHSANRPVEFQVRTHAMHRLAESGEAAHWRYKSRTALS